MSTTSILVVDDNDDLRSLIQHQLKINGFAVKTAVDPIEAIELVLSGATFDLILSDLQMPKASGTDLFDALQAGFSQIPFILMSGSLNVDESELERQGIRYFIKKPFSTAELLSMIVEALESPPRAVNKAI